MSAIFFEELDIPSPDVNLEVGSGPHGEQTGAMLSGVERVLVRERPDWVVVYGDTNSTLAGALAAAKLHIRVAHVEAGLRSFNRKMPEEINRVVTDHLSAALFCPSQTAVDNLVAEGITRGVCLVGDVMVDALAFAAERAQSRSTVLARLGVRERGYLLLTVHRAENTDDALRLGNILRALDTLEEPVLFPVHPRTRKAIEALGHRPAPHVRLLEPVGYLDMVRLEQSARMILTDSGGVQKEAYWLGVPCVTLRDETEWVETVQAGWNVLAGADASRIVRAVGSFVRPAARPALYGEAGAAERICMNLSMDLDAAPGGRRSNGSR
jgi:UDP-N-acetylglucosamine 2-epimerase